MSKRKLEFTVPSSGVSATNKKIHELHEVTRNSFVNFVAIVDRSPTLNLLMKPHELELEPLHTQICVISRIRLLPWSQCQVNNVAAPVQQHQHRPRAGTLCGSIELRSRTHRLPVDLLDHVALTHTSF